MLKASSKMKEIVSNLFIGSDLDCCHTNNDFAIIHACKTCHKAKIGYSKSLLPSHPNYLIYEKNNHLYLNMVDMSQELLPQFTHPMMKEAITFIEKYINKTPVLQSSHPKNKKSKLTAPIIH